MRRKTLEKELVRVRPESAFLLCYLVSLVKFCYLSGLIFPYLRGLSQGFSAGVPQEFLKHAIPDCLVRGPDLFPSIVKLKNGNSQHRSSHLVGMNKDYAHLFWSYQHKI